MYRQIEQRFALSGNITLRLIKVADIFRRKTIKKIIPILPDPQKDDAAAKSRFVAESAHRFHERPIVGLIRLAAGTEHIIISLGFDLVAFGAVVQHPEKLLCRIVENLFHASSAPSGGVKSFFISPSLMERYFAKICSSVSIFASMDDNRFAIISCSDFLLGIGI